MPSGKVRVQTIAGAGWKVNPEVKVALSAFGFVTTTLTAPAEDAGVTAVIWVELTTATEVAAALPKVTVTPARKPVPVRVTSVPPAAGPLPGEMPLRVGGLRKVKPLARLALWPLLFVTVTLTAPAEDAGVMAVIWVELLTLTELARPPPKETVAPASKSLPVMATAVPPPVGPLAGETLANSGARDTIDAGCSPCPQLTRAQTMAKSSTVQTSIVLPLDFPWSGLVMNSRPTSLT